MMPSMFIILLLERSKYDAFNVYYFIVGEK